MAIYWDQCAVTFDNKSGRLMTFSDADATTGFIAETPTDSVDNDASGAFTGSSTSGLTSGCGGEVVYRLDDGTDQFEPTLVNVRYWTAYPYGSADSSSYNVGFQGANADRYRTQNNYVRTDHSNGGAGKKVTWTFDIVEA